MRIRRRGGRAPRRRQWHRVYFGLAFFDVVVVALGLLLNHQIIDIHDEAIRTNQVWEQRLDRYLDLGTTAGELNAPGNDVFDTRDVDAESARRDEALRRLGVQMAAVRRDLRTLAPQHAEVLRTDLEVLEARTAAMTAEADGILGYLDADRPDLAGSRMAAMDRLYHQVSAAITDIRDDVEEIQQELFSEQAEHAESLRSFEVLIAFFVISMIILAIGYGHRIRKEMERRDSERARYTAEMEKIHRRLAGANVLLGEEMAARRQAEASLRLSEERYALAARGANDGLWDWDLQTGEVYYAPRWKTLLGFAEDELSDRPVEWLDRVHPDDRADLHARLKSAIEAGGTFEIEHRVRHREGSYRWMLARGVATARGGARRLVGSHTDVTTRKEAELTLVHDSLHDGLTGLPNRALFLDRLEHVLQRGRRMGTGSFAALYVDLDRFKQVNDSLGHLAGDELLVKFAGVLRRVIRSGDTAARLGGDEFIILLEDVRTEDDATNVAERILAQLQQRFLIDGTHVYASASIGIALGDPRCTSTTDVLRHADAALYQAKHAGRGCLRVFEPEKVEQLADDPTLGIDPRGAVASNELHQLNQPVVAPGTEDTTTIRGRVT